LHLLWDSRRPRVPHFLYSKFMGRAPLPTLRIPRKSGRTRTRLGEDTMAVAAGSSARARASEGTRWGQLIFGIICMVMIANLQYGWTLFVNPIDAKYHWGRAAIQVAF